MDLPCAEHDCNCPACKSTRIRKARLKAADVLNRAIQATETHVQKTSSSQDNDVLVANSGQKTAHDGDGVYRFLYRIFALPPEIREMVWRFACGGDLTIRVVGVEPNGIISAMLALEDQQLRSEGVMGVWKSFPLEWEGYIEEDRAWQSFRQTVIPHIRCLTINFSLPYKNVFNRKTEIGDTIAWIERRGKRANRARYTWNLEQLHLVGFTNSWETGVLGWYSWPDRPLPGCKPLSEHGALKRLVKNGLEVTVETKLDPEYW